MKLSLIKLPALFGVLYAAFTAIVLIAASVMAFSKGFSTTAVGTTLMNWEPHWWYLSIVGGGLHLLSFIKSRSRKLLVVNTIGVCLFIGYALVPNYALVLLVIHVIVIEVMAKTPVHPIQPSEVA